MVLLIQNKNCVGEFISSILNKSVWENLPYVTGSFLLVERKIDDCDV